MSDIENALRALKLQKGGSSDSNKELMGALAELMSAVKEKDYDPSGIKKVEPLREALQQFQVQHNFQVGDIVRWKNGMKNRKKPVYGEPAVVVEYVHDNPILLTERGAETPYFREPLNLLLGLLDEDNDFVVYHYDSRRFEPWPNV